MPMHAGVTRAAVPVGGRRKGVRVSRPWGKRGFSLPELLVVIGVIALLLAILAPPLKLAHRQALSTRCGAQLQQIGLALHAARDDSRFYPLWDDNGRPKRYTWVDLLVQRTYLGNCAVGYCPEDPCPSPLNTERVGALKLGIVYPGGQNALGIDYSYGLAMPLSAAAWAQRSSVGPAGTSRPPPFVDYDRYTAQRVLAAEGNWSVLYNFSADALFGHSVVFPTRYDNTIDWRHPNTTSNLLFQDGHVSSLRYVADAEMPVNTMRQFFCYAGEALHIGPGDQADGNYYPDVPAATLESGEGGGAFPREMSPGYYTRNMLWTRILHK